MFSESLIALVPWSPPPEHPNGLPRLEREYVIELEGFKPLDTGDPPTIEAFGNDFSSGA